MIKYFCDRCGQEMQQSISVQISSEGPALSSRPDRISVQGWKTLDVCPECGKDLRAAIESKVERTEKVEAESAEALKR